MKRSYSFIFLIFCLIISANSYFSSSAQGQEVSHEEAVKEIKDMLTFDVIKGQNEDKLSIREDLNLIVNDESLANYGVRILWSSDNEAYITSDGRVNRPEFGEDDVDVTLVATLWRSSALDTSEFNLRVQAKGSPVEEEIRVLLQKLAFSHIAGDNTSAQEITESLYLPSDDSDLGDKGITLSWTSSHPEIVDSQGQVQRPAYGERDVEVDLTVTLEKEGLKEEKKISLLVKAETEPPRYPSAIYVEGEEALILSSRQTEEKHYNAVLLDQLGDPMDAQGIGWRLFYTDDDARLLRETGEENVLILEEGFSDTEIQLTVYALEDEDVETTKTITIQRQPYMKSLSAEAEDNRVVVHFSQAVYWDSPIEGDALYLQVDEEQKELVGLDPRSRDEAQDTMIISVKEGSFQGGEDLTFKLSPEATALIVNEDGVEAEYLEEALTTQVVRTGTRINSFALNGIQGKIHQEQNLIEVLIPPGESLTDLVPTFSISPGARILLNGEVLESGVSAVDSTESVLLTVQSETGEEQDYEVVVRRFERIAIEGEEALQFPDEETLKYSYTGILFDQHEEILEEKEVEWDVVPSDAGVTISSDGVLTVTREATEDQYIIIASAADAPELTTEKEVFLRKVDSLEIQGDSQILMIPGLVHDRVYRVRTIDQTGEDIEGDSVVWNLEEDYPGIFIRNPESQEARLVVGYTQPGTIKITATSEANPQLQSTKEILLVRPPMLETIQGNLDEDTLILSFNKPVWWEEEISRNKNDLKLWINGEEQDFTPLSSRPRDEAHKDITLTVQDIQMADGDEITLILYHAASKIKSFRGVPLSYGISKSIVIGAED